MSETNEPEPEKAEPDQQAADEGAGTFEALGRMLDRLPPLEAANDALKRAKAELARAGEAYQSARAEADETVEQLRERSVGDLYEAGVEYVREKPTRGVIAAVAVGFLLGRLFKR